ncbi:MAG: hypothetical protein ACYSW6_04850 [Planctomycetota bacterium]
MSLSLRVHSRVLDNQGFIEDVTTSAIGWRRSIRAQGGYWQGEFSLTGDIQYLARWFYQFLGFHFIERSAGRNTWEGLIYEMDFTTTGVTRRRSLDMLYNNVKVRYIDTNNEIALTTAASDSDSISTYGQRDQIWPIDGQDLTAAAAVRDSILQEYMYPYGRTVGTTIGEESESSLIVRVCGYAFTANWRYETAGDNTDDNLSDWLSEIITTDCEFLNVGKIESNTLQVRKETRVEMRAWDVITKMLEMGNSDQPVRAYVDNDRYFNYETIDTTPQYFKRGDGLYGSAGSNLAINPWQVRPAVVRDLTYPVSKVELGAWLDDARDWYISEVEVWDVGDGETKLVLKSEEYEESEILTAQEVYQEMIRRMKEREQ